MAGPENDLGTVLILGADGFVGRHIAFGLRAAGWRVIAHARRPARLARMGFETLELDLTRAEASDPDFWRPRLSGVTHLVNTAGLLTGSHRQFKAVHVTAPNAIYASLPSAAQSVLISAVGIDTAQTRFAAYRRAGEDIAHRYDVTLLRPGLILGDTSYGGSSLLRALSALPLRVPVVGAGDQQFNPLHVQDLAVLVSHCLLVPKAGTVQELGGPETVTLAQMQMTYRTWLGLPGAKLLRLPMWLAGMLGKVGDLMRLGPISTAALAQLHSGVLAYPGKDSAGLPRLRGFSEFMAARPAGTQDLWHARFYLLRPVLRIVLAALWLVSGLLGLGLPAQSFLPLVPGTGLPDTALIVMARCGGVVDLFLAAALIRGWRPRFMAGIQALMVTIYTLAFSMLAPALWLLPLGGLMKNIPILALIGTLAILEDER